MEKKGLEKDAQHRLLEVWVNEGQTFIKNRLTPSILMIDKEMKFSSVPSKSSLER
jgi:hypothetical protein